MILDGRPICVLGILDTKKGVDIANAMERWLCRVYDVHELLHDGTQFELPALKEAQRISMETGQPVLYLHTRGAVNTYWTTEKTHKMWCEEFGVQWHKYQYMVEGEQPRVACPFVDWDTRTRYNGFIANAAAWSLVDLHPVEDRHEYEDIWGSTKGVNVMGTLLHFEAGGLQEIHDYLRRNY